MYLKNSNKNSSLWTELLKAVSLYPQSDSIIFSDEAYSYLSLKMRAIQIASALTMRGAKAGMRVGVCLPRGLNQIACAFAIFKMGAIFVPIRESSNFEYIVKDSEISILICTSNIDGISEHIEVVLIDSINSNETSLIDAQHINNTRSCDETCAILYTSGTTSTPKGVLINSRMLLNYAEEASIYMKLINGSRFALFPPVIYIDAMHIITATLFSGATLCIMSEGDVSNPSSISAFLETFHITHFYAHPEIANGITPNAELAFFQTGGTPAKRDLIKRIPSGCTYSNGYGLTEAGAFLYWCHDGKSRTAIPLGTPIIGARIYIQRDGTLCNGAEVGELCVAGDCLSNGYVRRYDDSENRFTTNPFDDGVLLRTGDLVSRNEFGEILYVGRINKKRMSHYTNEQLEDGIMERCENCKIVVVRNDESIYIFAQLIKDISLDTVKQAMEGHFQKLGLPTNNVYIQEVNYFPFTENNKILRNTLLSKALSREES